MANERRRHRISPTAPARFAGRCPRRPPHSAPAQTRSEKSPAHCAETAREIAAAPPQNPQNGAWVPGTSLGVFSLPANSQFWTNNFEEVSHSRALEPRAHISGALSVRRRKRGSGGKCLIRKPPSPHGDSQGNVAIPAESSQGRSMR